MRKKRTVKQLLIIIIMLTLIGGLSGVSPVAAAKKIPFIGAVFDGTGLEGAYSVAVSPDGQHLYVAGIYDNAVAVFSRDNTTGALTYIQHQKDGVGGVDGLDGATSVVVSPDGQHLYVTSENDNAVVVFSRDQTTGTLRYLEHQQDGIGGVDGLAGANSVVVSPDGQHLYVASYHDNAVAVFSRDDTTGALTFVEHQQDGLGGVDGLAAAWAVTLSPDGQHLYVAGEDDDAVAVFGRDDTTGVLTFVELQQDGLGGVEGLAGAFAVTLSPDGQYVYVAGYSDNAVAVFGRDGTTGALTFVELQQDGLGSVDGLDGPWSVVVSPDGQHLYVAGYNDNAVAAFIRDQTTGTLTFVEYQQDGLGGVDGLIGATSVALSPDGQHLHVASQDDNAVAVFSRDDTTGTLTYVKQQQDGVGGVDGLADARSVVVSSDGRHLYVTGTDDNAVAVFSRDVTTGNLTFVEHQQDGVDGVEGLQGARLVTLSPDGQHLYVAGTNDDAVAVFNRDDTTGALTFVEHQQDGVGGVEGLNGAFAVALSLDGQHLYVGSIVDDAVVVFSRDGTTGTLTYVELQQDGVGDVDGLNAPRSVTVSLDGRHLYVTGTSDDAVVVFSRDDTTGALTYVEQQQDGVDGVDGLAGAYSGALSPDGQYLYVASQTDDAVAVFSRDDTTGALTYIQHQKDGVGGVDGLDVARSVTVSPDGQYVYVASTVDNAVVVFSRNETTGALTFVEQQRDGVNGVDGLADARSVVVSPDGQHVYVTGNDDDAVVIFGSFLFLNKEADQVQIQPGQSLTYRLTISNSGSLAASSGVLSDTLPSGINFVGPVTIQGGSGTEGTPPLIATNLTIPAGQTMTVSFPVTVSTELTPGTVLTNTATVHSSEVETPVKAQVTTVVGGKSSSIYLPLLLRDGN